MLGSSPSTDHDTEYLPNFKFGFYKGSNHHIVRNTAPHTTFCTCLSAGGRGQASPAHGLQCIPGLGSCSGGTLRVTPGTRSLFRFSGPSPRPSPGGRGREAHTHFWRFPLITHVAAGTRKSVGYHCLGHVGLPERRSSIRAQIRSISPRLMTSMGLRPPNSSFGSPIHGPMVSGVIRLVSACLM